MAKPTDDVTFSIKIPRIVRDHMRETAISRKRTMSRTLVDCYLKSLDKTTASNLRDYLPLARSVAGLAPDSPYDSCERCLVSHPNMPDTGPWHAKECMNWRQRRGL